VGGFILSFIASITPHTLLLASSRSVAGLGIRGDREEPVGHIHALHCDALTAGRLCQRSVSPVEVEYCIGSTDRMCLLLT
jgi:hypothetical protein